MGAFDGEYASMEFTLFKPLSSEEIDELNLGEEYDEGAITVLDFFARELNEYQEYVTGRFIYKNAAQNTFEQSAVNFRPGDFIEADEPSLGWTELIKQIVQNSDIGNTDINQLAQFDDLFGEPDLFEVSDANISLNDLFNRPCYKILLAGENSSDFYDACNAVKDYPLYNYTSLDVDLTLQRVVYDEDEKDGGKGLDGKDPTSEKVDEHFDWLVPSPGGAQ